MPPNYSTKWGFLTTCYLMWLLFTLNFTCLVPLTDAILPIFLCRIPPVELAWGDISALWPSDDNRVCLAASYRTLEGAYLIWDFAKCFLESRFQAIKGGEGSFSSFILGGVSSYGDLDLGFLIADSAFFLYLIVGGAFIKESSWNTVCLNTFFGDFFLLVDTLRLKWLGLIVVWVGCLPLVSDPCTSLL